MNCDFSFAFKRLQNVFRQRGVEIIRHGELAVGETDGAQVRQRNLSGTRYTASLTFSKQDGTRVERVPAKCKAGRSGIRWMLGSLVLN